MAGSIGGDRPSRSPGVVGNRPSPTYHFPVGFNPFRKQSRTTLDVALVVVFAAITIALVMWGFFG